ncbi:hypothetical protein HMPREF9944_02420 [Segatella maculosa OT 289]|uniref:Uncharacterized protein n=1 Tax=Segatella maculosa OT 289 TaxID=999422 RepID=H1HQH6_9BACT|nr:hypothetical protein HMPREF9944_02420 [Segatella maculosa OT 289]
MSVYSDIKYLIFDVLVNYMCDFGYETNMRPI